MKFLADMGISPKTVSFLNSLAHDAVHLKDQGLQRAFDSFILEKALNEGRVLLTHDLDFAELRWTHLSRQFFRKVKLHFGAVFCFYLCAPSP